MKGILLVLRVTLVKTNVVRKLDEINILIQLKVQNHQNSFEAINHCFTWAVNLEASYITL